MYYKDFPPWHIGHHEYSLHNIYTPSYFKYNAQFIDLQY